jgi:hypothetical protein
MTCVRSIIPLSLWERGDLFANTSYLPQTWGEGLERALRKLLTAKG